MGKFLFNDEDRVWSRISYYSHPDENMPGITLLPMAHLGEAGFYQEINDEIWCHDTVYLEGCYAPGQRGLYLFHRLLGWRSKLSLQSGKVPFFRKWIRASDSNLDADTLQESVATFKCDCGECSERKLRHVRADFHYWHTARAIKAIPWWSKTCFPFLVMAAVLTAPFLSLRDYICDFDDDEDDGDKDTLISKFLKPYLKFITDDRDLFLRMVLSEEIIDEANHAKALCVKYGAKHMPVLAETLLANFDYELVGQRDVLAIAKDKSVNLETINTGYGVAYKKLWRADEPQQTYGFLKVPERIDSLSTTYQNSSFGRPINNIGNDGFALDMQFGLKEEFGLDGKAYKFEVKNIEVRNMAFPVDG